VFTRISAVFFVLFAGIASAEVHSLTLRQALEIAANQNPDIALARLDEEHAIEGVRIAQDPFRPKVYGGSGLAYTYGYPNSIEGNAPSLFQVRTDMSLYNRPKSYQVKSAKEVARGSQHAARAKADDVAYQTADLFLTASQLEHQGSTISSQLPSLERVLDATAAGVSEGNELPLDLKRAKADLAVSQQQLQAANLDADYYEMELAIVLGYSANDRVKPVDSDFASIVTPPTEDAAADTALRNNQELRELQSNILAKQLDVRSFKAARLPVVDLVAQYALFAHYNYEQYFQKFQRNNFQLGASVAIPIFIGSATSGLKQQAYTDLSKLRIQMSETRNRILAETRRSYDQWKKAETMRDLKFVQLDLARENLNVLLSQNKEGRASLRDVEQARLDEGNRWLEWYDAQTQVARTKFAILRQTGNLIAAVRTLKGSAEPE